MQMILKLILSAFAFAILNQSAVAGFRHQVLPLGEQKTRHKEAQENSRLREYLEKELKNTDNKSEKWAEKILQAIATQDLSKVRTAIEEFLIEDQMFLDADQERLAFGKLLREFSPIERKKLVIKYTKGQQEIRDKLVTEVSRLIQASGKPSADTVAETLSDIKKDHLEFIKTLLKKYENEYIDSYIIKRKLLKKFML
jgi:hypothetical protein